MGYRRTVVFLGATILLAACAREDAGPSVAPDKLSEQTGMPLAEVPTWVREAPRKAELTCYLDVVEGAAARDSSGWRAEGGSPLRILGWAVDTTTKDAVQAPVTVVLSDAKGIRAFTGARGERPDVTAAEPFKAVAPKMAGVAADVAAGSLPPGTYDVSYVVGVDGQAAACPLGEPNRVVVP